MAHNFHGSAKKHVFFLVNFFKKSQKNGKVEKKFSAQYHSFWRKISRTLRKKHFRGVKNQFLNVYKGQKTVKNTIRRNMSFWHSSHRPWNGTSPWEFMSQQNGIVWGKKCAIRSKKYFFLLRALTILHTINLYGTPCKRKRVWASIHFFSRL